DSGRISDTKFEESRGGPEMTREEALAYAISQKAGVESELHRTPCGYGNWAVYSTVLDFINAAISALKGPTREQVEKMRGKFFQAGIDDVAQDTWRCSWCLVQEFGNIQGINFCPSCGAPMTDEAVDMVMERMEELYNA